MLVSVNKVETQTDKPIHIWIGDTYYTLKETADGKLSVNKSDGNDGPLAVYPRYANEIDIN